MTILIDEKPADITLDTEKNVGDVLSALEGWLTGSGLGIAGIMIDGAIIGSTALDAAFTTEITAVNELSLVTVPVAALCLDALRTAQLMLKANDCAAWKLSPAAGFLHSYERELVTHLDAAFAEGSSFDLERIIAERERELNDPAAEFLSLEDSIEDTTNRLENFALDLQMGKDRQAAETAAQFAALAAKVFRLVPLLRCTGLRFEDLELGDGFFEEFSAALREFFSAYEAGDTVLSGDLAEYEVAPRLKDFYMSLKKHSAYHQG
ncbi:MAG: hypothetical protein LBD22_04235 [Spirochaetaceae bacterium]|jgi:hypothetical protein|nr:hypothetical protein [Spirochaetaceae bacterium]